MREPSLVGPGPMAVEDSGPEDPGLVFVPDQAVPVGEEDETAGQESPEVLGGQVVGNLPPGDLPHHGQGHRHGRVEVAA